MNDVLSVDQWQGFFSYGPDYGEIVEGAEVEFRLFIEEFKDGIFSGRVIDWEGLGADGEVSTLKGFIDNDKISFIKQYNQFHIIDEWGNSCIQDESTGYTVEYEGLFEQKGNLL